MKFELLFKIIAGLALVVLQAGFISALPYPVSALNAILVACLFVLGMDGLLAGLYWGLPLALAGDLAGPAPFGLGAVSLALALALAAFLQQGYLTNRSLYSYLALALASDLLYRTLAAAAYALAAWQDKVPAAALDQPEYWRGQAWALGLDLVLVAAVFLALNYISRRFRPVFLVKPNQSPSRW